MTADVDVRAILHDVVRAVDALDETQRAMLPAPRTIQAVCTDVDVTCHVHWRDGELSPITDGAADDVDIHIALTSTDLAAIHGGTMTFSQAWFAGRIQLQASMTDLLRFKALF